MISGYLIYILYDKMSREKNSLIRQKIYNLEKERNTLIWRLLNSLQHSTMIPATFSLIKKTCGKRNCKCKKGEKHGPYPAIQIKIGKTRTLKMVNKEDEEKIIKKTKLYKDYQIGLTKINRLNIQIHKLLQKVRDENLEEYP